MLRPRDFPPIWPLGGTTGGSGAGFHDQVFVDKVTGGTDGLVTLTGSDLDVSLFGGFVPAVDDTFTIIDNDEFDAVVGTFNGLAEGASFDVAGAGSVHFEITYLGGDGNDVVLEAVPEPGTFAVLSIGAAAMLLRRRRSGVRR